MYIDFRTSINSQQNDFLKSFSPMPNLFRHPSSSCLADFGGHRTDEWTENKGIVKLVNNNINDVHIYLDGNSCSAPEKDEEIIFALFMML